VSLAQFAVLITYREILGREPQIADLHALLAKYQRREVIFLFAKLNCLLGTWQNTPNFDVDEKLSQIFLRSYFDQLVMVRRANGGRLLFSRITLLYLIKQACLACGEAGELLDNEQAYADIGIACLMANDLLLPFVPGPNDGTLERLANILPFSDYVPSDHYPMEIARTQEMFGEISQLSCLKARSDFMDLKALFESAMG
jgi:hypothetical protein